MARSFWVNTNKSQAISSAIRDIDKFQDKTQRNIKDAIADSTRAVKDAAVSGSGCIAVSLRNLSV